MWRAIKVAFFAGLAILAALLASRQRGKEQTSKEIADHEQKINNHLSEAKQHRAKQSAAKKKAEAHEKRANELLGKAADENETVGDFLSRWNKPRP